MIRLKPNRHALTHSQMVFTYIDGKPFVLADKHYDKHGNFNGYLLPIDSKRFEYKHFVWTEYLHIYGLKVA